MAERQQAGFGDSERKRVVASMEALARRTSGTPARRPVLPTAAATGIGSLPHVDPAEAVALVLDAVSELPAAPQLPRRHAAEGMLAQALDGVPGASVDSAGAVSVDTRALDAEAPVDTTFDGESWGGLRAFLDAVATRRGPVKLQLTGPLTIGIALLHAGAPADVAFDVAAAAVRERGRALVAYAAGRAPDAELVVVLDEPGLVAWGTDDLPPRGDDVVDLLSGGLASLGPNVLTGVHCCGDTDWKIATSAGPDIISLPVTPRVAEAASTLAGFLDRGGLLAWGVVPTDRPIGQEVEPLWRRLSDVWRDLATGGCDAVRLRQQAIVTPACGLANHDPAQAARILDLAVGVADRVHSQAVAIRMSVGA